MCWKHGDGGRRKRGGRGGQGAPDRSINRSQPPPTPHPLLGHKVKELGTKWSNLLGTRTNLTENIRPPHTVWTAAGRLYGGGSFEE